MKKAWTDLKSFVTVAMVALLFVIVIANLMGCNLEQSVLLLATNIITMVITYYFTRKTDNKTDDDNTKDL